MPHAPTPYALRRGKLAALMLLLAILSCAGIALCTTLGAARMPLPAFWAAVRAHFSDPGSGGTPELIIFGIRLPRALLSYLVGASLAVSGVTMQGIFKNPMAEPHILGVSSGAAFGAAIALIFSAGVNLLGLGIVSVGAMLGALGAAALVLMLSGGGRGGATNLLLSGVAVGTFLSALLSGLLMLNHDKMEAVYTWTMGSFQTATMAKVQLLLPVALLGTATVRFFARDLNAMLMGEADARALGVNVGRTRLALLLVSTLMTAVSVSLSGVIGFVGLMVPHAVRLLIGPDHRGAAPVSALLGGLYLLLMDTLARTLFVPTELPVGVLTALFGGPFFLYLLRRSRRKGAAS